MMGSYFFWTNSNGFLDRRRIVGVGKNGLYKDK